MCILIPSVRRNMKICKRCTKATPNVPCTYCGFEEMALTDNYRDSHSIKQQLWKKHNL